MRSRYTRSVALWSVEKYTVLSQITQPLYCFIFMFYRFTYICWFPLHWQTGNWRSEGIADRQSCNVKLNEKISYHKSASSDVRFILYIWWVFLFQVWWREMKKWNGNMLLFHWLYVSCIYKLLTCTIPLLLLSISIYFIIAMNNHTHVIEQNNGSTKSCLSYRTTSVMLRYV